MGQHALLKIAPGTSVAIAGPRGEEPAGELYMAARRAMHSAKARAGGELDEPGDGPACLSRPADLQLAVGIVVCSLVGDGFTVRILPSSVPFEDVP